MPDSATDALFSPGEAELTEQRMRRALGLVEAPARVSLPAAAAPRPAPESTALKEREAALEAQLAQERARHAETRRELAGAQKAARAGEAQLVREAEAHRLALEAERRALLAAQRALNEALGQLQKRQGRERPVPAGAPPPAEPRQPVRARRVSSAAEPKPVRWWTAGYRARGPAAPE